MSAQEQFDPGALPLGDQARQWDKLFAALAKAQAKIEGASKDKKNPAFNSKYADLASVWEACRSALTEQGLCVVQQPLSDGDRVGLRTTLGHSSGQWMASVVWTTPKDKTPQALGSCLTYLRRYSLAAAVGVTPDEDDDGNAASGRGAEGKARAAGTSYLPAQKASAEGKAEDPPPREYSTTGSPTTPSSSPAATTTASAPTAKLPTADTVKHDGKFITPEQLVKLHVTRKQAGGSYCTDEDDPKSLWRMKVLGVYRDQQGQRISSSKQLSVAQASHLIERLAGYIAKTNANIKPLDIPAAGGNDVLASQIKAKGLSQTDMTEYILGPFGADSTDELEEDDKPKALALLLAYAQGYEPYCAAMRKLGFKTDHLL